MKNETSKNARPEPEKTKKEERIPKKIYQLEESVDREMDLLYYGMDRDD